MMLSPDEQSKLQIFFSQIPVIRAYLFGSMARGDAKTSSDIDILVELDHTQPIGMKFFEYRIDIEALLNKSVDIITTEGLSRHLKPFIDRDKILIYERENQ